MMDKMINQEETNQEKEQELSSYERDILNKLNDISKSLDEAYQKGEERLEDEKKESIQKVYYR